MISVSEKHFVHFLRFHARKLEIASFFPYGGSKGTQKDLPRCLKAGSSLQFLLVS